MGFVFCEESMGCFADLPRRFNYWFRHEYPAECHFLVIFNDSYFSVPFPISYKKVELISSLKLGFSCAVYQSILLDGTHISLRHPEGNLGLFKL